MTFTFAQPLKLLAIGGSLITSTSFWFFNPHSPLPLETQTRTSDQPSAKVSPADEDKNINLFSPAPKLSTLTPTLKEDSRITKTSSANNNTLTFTIKEPHKEFDLIRSSEKLDDFSIANIKGLRSQYKALSKEDIKIKLFKDHAWFSSSPAASHVDEFKDPLTPEQINDLFDGIDETKAKQLLLSLQKRLEWKYHWNTGTKIQYFGQIPYLSLVHSPEGLLKDLKVKYFSEFNDLKDYVQKKVKESCKDDTKACIAHPDELTFHNTDSLNYFSQ